MFWIFTGAEIAILSLAIIGCVSGFVQIQKLSHSFRKPYDLDNLLSSVTIVGAYIYAIFSIIAAGINIETLDTKNIVVMIQKPQNPKTPKTRLNCQPHFYNPKLNDIALNRPSLSRRTP